MARMRGEGFDLAVTVLRYEREAMAHDSDWLVAEVDARFVSTEDRRGEYAARQSLTIVADEVERFVEELRALDRDLTGTAAFRTLESQLEIEARLSAGRGEIRGIVKSHYGGEMRFATDIDQTYVRSALGEFERLAQAFPTRRLG